MNRREAVKTVGLSLGVSAGLQLAAASQEDEKPTRDILMLVYPKFTALDLVGPHHVLSSLPGYRVRLVWKNKDELFSDTGIPIRPTATFKDCPENPAVLFVPGGTNGTVAAMEDPEVRAFLASRGAKAGYVTSVCTGALVLGAAGLLKGYKATTHWLTLETLKQFGAEPVAQRVVEDRNRITGGGVTAGIDFGLTLAAKLKDETFAKGVQLIMEYDPEPPFRSGSPKVADPAMVKSVRGKFAPFLQDLNSKAKRLSS